MSKNKSTPVSSIFSHTRKTSGLFSKVGFSHSRLRFAPAAFVRRLPQYRAVGVHVRYDIESGAVEQDARNRVLRIEQATEQPFDKPFRHRFARMLARDNPDFHVAFDLVADGQQIDVAVLHGVAQVVNAAKPAALRVAQEV